MANKLDDDDIVAILLAGTKMAVGYGSKLSKEREKTTRYRDGELPARNGPNDSSFVSLDVFEGTESMKAQLLEVFSGNKRPVTFDPYQGEPADVCKVRTDYVTDVIFAQNPGFKMLQETIDDGLMGRTSVVKTWWESITKEEEYDLSDASFQTIQQFLATNPGAKIKEVEEYDLGDPRPGDVDLKRVRFSIRKDRSKVRMAVVPPEEFGISPRATCIDDADVCFHRQRKSVSELLDMGFSKSVVEDLQQDGRIWLDMEPEVIARFNPTDDTQFSTSIENGTAKKTCLLFECYANLDVDGTGIAKLWKCMLVGNVLLHKERVNARPFSPFTPIPRAHSFWGSSYAAQLIPIQNARTYLMRSTINHAIVTNNPRIQVVKGALLNPRELTENRFGGIVNVTRPDGLIPLPQASLNPFIFQAITMLQNNKEQITGISGLAQGLDKDAISKQNSGEMVHELITVSQVRQKIIARNFADGFLRDLYSKVHTLVSENEDRAKIARISGKWVEVDFTQWPEDCMMSVSFSLGYGEQDKETAKWFGMHKLLSGDPSLAPNYGPEQKYQVIREALESGGIRNVDTYWLPMDKAQPQQPDPLMLAKVDAMKADAEVKRANAQAAIQGVQVKQQMHQTKAAIDEAKLQHLVAVDGAELELQRQVASHAATQDARAVISVKG